MKISIHGKDVVIRDQARKVVHSILSVKDYIGSIAFAEPHAALAWAGILIILPVSPRIPRDSLPVLIVTFDRLLQIQSHKLNTALKVLNIYQNFWFGVR